MGSFRKRIIVFVLSILMGFAPSTAVFAYDSNAFIDAFSQNDILYYDPSECVDEGENEQTCTLPSGEDITWIGDSYSVGAQSEIEAAFSGISFGSSVDDKNSQIQDGKTVSGGSDNNPSGLTILKKIIKDEKLKPFLVFALGTNDQWNSSKVDSFNKIMDGKDTKVLFVNSKTKNSDYKDSNNVLKEMVDANDNYSLADWAKVAEDSWFDSEGIHPSQGDGYKVWINAIKDAMPRNCSGQLCGSNAKEKYWTALTNHFGAAAAAGIMGNIDNEGGLSPTLMEQIPGHVAFNLSTMQWENGWTVDNYFTTDESPANGNITGIGAFQISSGRSKYLQYVEQNEPDLAKYFKDPMTYSTGDGNELISLIGEAKFDKMVMMEVEWMYKTLEGDAGFDLNSFKNMGDPGKAAVHFLLKYERPADQGEAEQNERAEAAKRAYDELKDFRCSQGGSSADFSTTEGLSSTANVKYDATDSELEFLLKFAIWKAQKDDGSYRNVLSRILDDYESSGGEKGKAKDLVEYVKSGTDFIYRDDYDKYVKDKPKVKVKKGHIEGAKIVVNDGNRVDSENSATIVPSRAPEVNYCPGGKGGSGKIAEIAAKMSWPVQSWQTDADDYDSKRVGKCDGGNGSWIDYQFDQEPCMSNPRDLYRKNYNTFPGQGWYDMYEDCGYFVSTVLHYAGVADESTKYKMTGQPTMAGSGEYAPGDLEESSDWTEIDNTGESAMKPGDVLINDAHVMIYVGEKYGGSYGTVAHASRGTRVGEVGTLFDAENYRIYRYSGDKLGGGDVEGGLNYEQAKKFMMNYGANKNNVSLNAIGYLSSVVCHGGPLSNCVSFSAFFMNKFTSMQYNSGNGNMVVTNAIGKLKRGKEPKIWAVFSWDSADGNGHTGVILGKEGDEWIVGHAGCDRSGTGKGDGTEAGGGAGVVVKSSDINVAAWGAPSGYAYPEEVDTDAIQKFIETGE